MYIVKREVLAKNIKEALTVQGVVYSIEIAAESFQPEHKAKPIRGFKNG